jgi:hypothetical protein
MKCDSTNTRLNPSDAFRPFISFVEKIDGRNEGPSHDVIENTRPCLGIWSEPTMFMKTHGLSSNATMP